MPRADRQAKPARAGQKSGICTTNRQFPEKTRLLTATMRRIPLAAPKLNPYFCATSHSGKTK